MGVAHIKWRHGEKKTEAQAMNKSMKHQEKTSRDDTEDNHHWKEIVLQRKHQMGETALI